jgi:hypothetical protein
MGFSLPPLLGRLWVEVANGGFGPGYGLLGLNGGCAADVVNLTLPDLYRLYVELGAFRLRDFLSIICASAFWQLLTGNPLVSEPQKPELAFARGLRPADLTFAGPSPAPISAAFYLKVRPLRAFTVSVAIAGVGLVPV